MRTITLFPLASILLATVLLPPLASAAPPTMAQLYRQASPAVVLLMSSDGSGMVSTGTGSVIAQDGLILTNNHVIEDERSGNAWPQTIVFLRPAELTGDANVDLALGHPAAVVARDKTLDLAVLRIKGTISGLPTIPVAEPAGVSVGDPLVAIGHPHGGGLWTLTTGTLSAITPNWGAKGRDIYQTDASLNPGNSGGPLLSVDGRMVGVNKAVHRKGPDGLTITGIGFAIQARTVLGWLRLQGIAVVTAGPGVPPALAVAAPEAPPALETPAPAATPAATVPPVVEAAPAAPVAKAQSTRPAETAPSTRAPTAAAPPVAPPKVGPLPPRSYEGPGKQAMYGTPMPSLDLMKVAPSLFERARLDRDRAFQELDATPVDP